MNTRIQHPASSTQHRVSGFTLMEMILVLGIIGLLVGAGIYSMGDVLGSGKKKRALADLTTLSTALSNYEMSNGVLPSTEQGIPALVEKPSGRPQPQSWSPVMKKVILDPWKNPYNYRRPAQKDKGPFDVWSSGPDGISGNEDDIGNWDL